VAGAVEVAPVDDVDGAEAAEPADEAGDVTETCDDDDAPLALTAGLLALLPHPVSKTADSGTAAAANHCRRCAPDDWIVDISSP